ncbi:MAG: ornithine carbamoyltransferase, partial [Nitrososphaeria archaeon]|nr:ornithine carbamoyltransferase [Nitrososphaeria archaeon]
TNLVLADVRDETKYLSRNVEGIMARLLKNADLRAMAEASRVPVINGCDEKYHPCQAISDLMTIKEKKGFLKGLKLVYIGIHNNVCNSLIEGCTKVEMKITTVTPMVNEPAFDKELAERANRTGLYKTTLDVKEAVGDADIVYTDTWVDMEFF